MMLPMSTEGRYTEFYAPYLDFGDKLNSDFTPCNCPFHLDTKRSAGVNLENGVFNCFGCDTTLSAVKFYAQLTGCELQEARCVVENYLIENGLYSHNNNFVKSAPGKNPKFDKILSLTTGLVNCNMAIEYAQGRGISIDYLEKLGVRYIDGKHTHWKKDSLVFPYYLNGHCVGIRYRDSEGHKNGEAGCHFTLWGLDTLTDEDKVVIITEGESDRIRLYQELNEEFKVISTPGAVFKQEWEREFFGITRAILIPHADDAGQKHVVSATRVLGDRLKVLPLVWKRGQIGKDICDWLVYNSPEILIRDIKGLTMNSKRATIMKGDDFEKVANKPRRFFINNFFTRGQVAVVAGPPKNKKTLFTLYLLRVLLNKGEKFLNMDNYESVVDDCKVLFLEEEGDIEELYERSNRVLSGTNWRDNIHWGHRVGIRLDTNEGVDKCINYIYENNIDILVLDPFSKMFTVEEDSATDIGLVWSNVDRILSTCNDIGIIILHHFSKAGTINDLWNALRGSSRIGASADLGIFVQNRTSKEPIGLSMRFDGRTLKDFKAHDGGDIFKSVFNPNNGIFSIDKGITVVDKSDKLVEATKTNGPWSVADAAKYLGVQPPTIKNWCAKLKDKIEEKDSMLTYIAGA